MRLEGGCYCGQVRYVAEGDALMKAQCHCRECQYFTGGAPNIIVGMPAAGFSYAKGEPKGFKRAGLERAVTREFCPNCGTQLTARVPGMPLVIVKVGTLDDPAVYDGPDIAIYTIDQRSFHHIAEGVTAFERLPG